MEDSSCRMSTVNRLQVCVPVAALSCPVCIEYETEKRPFWALLFCVGATVYAEKTIYVSEAGSTLHEFGHFLYHILGCPDEVEQLYRDEAKTESVFCGIMR